MAQTNGTEFAMRFVVIFGPPAVGKMTVGRELAQLTGLRLFHNHLTIEPLLGLFEFGEPAFFRLVNEFRRLIFAEVAQSDLPGLIFTFVWGLELESDRIFIEQAREVFREKGGETFFVELAAAPDERLRRDQTPLRREHKPSKRDPEAARAHLLEMDAKYKMNTDGDFFYAENYLKLDNTHLTASAAAQQIVAAFGW